MEFLKWFTQPEHNISFSVDSGYLPVTTAANDMEAIKTSGLELSPKMERILSNAVQSVKNNTLYTPSAFVGGSKARKVLEYSLSDLASADRATVQERVAAGQPAADAEAEFLTDEYFDAWYGASALHWRSTPAERNDRKPTGKGRSAMKPAEKYRAWKAHRPEKPIFRTILFSMMAVLLAEVILLSTGIGLTNVSGRLNQNAKQIVNMQVRNRASYLQDMLIKAQELTDISTTINNLTQQMLQDGTISLDTMDQSSEAADPLMEPPRPIW